MRRQNRNAFSKSGFLLIPELSEASPSRPEGGQELPEEASRDPAAIKAAVEGLMADVAFELEAERSTLSLRGKRVTAPTP